MSANIAEEFGKMIALGMKIQAENQIKEKHAKENERLRVIFEKLSTLELKKLWDQYDGSDPYVDGFEDIDIHGELNRRGEGSYCAV